MKKKQIVFFCTSHPFIMIYKMARIFKEKGYETILIAICEKERIDYKFYKHAFDKIIYPNFRFSKQSLKNIPYILRRGYGLIKFLISIRLLKPYAVIGVAGNNWPLKLAHKHLFRNLPLIYFPYDILSHFFKSREEALKAGVLDFEIKAERYCFEKTDGIIHKGDSDELKPLEGRMHKRINFTKPLFNFLPYLTKEFKVPINKNRLSKKSGEFHLVYTGFLSDDHKFIKRLLDIFNEFIKQKIHIHIYGLMNHISKKEEAKYMKKLFEPIYNEKYFHLHRPLGAKEIIKEISKYDFGFWPAWVAHSDSIEPFYSTGNKVASYFEAGLSFIYDNKCYFLHKLMSSFNLEFPLNKKNIKNLGKKLKKLDYKKFERNIKKAREEFDMDKHFPELEKFIQEIVKKKNNR